MTPEIFFDPDPAGVMTPEYIFIYPDSRGVHGPDFLYPSHGGVMLLQKSSTLAYVKHNAKDRTTSVVR